MQTLNPILPPRAADQPWSLKAAAFHLGVSEKTLMRLAAAGKLRITRVGCGRGRILVPASEVARLAGVTA
jgi:excisionase family DNA binding protein